MCRLVISCTCNLAFRLVFRSVSGQLNQHNAMKVCDGFSGGPMDGGTGFETLNLGILL